ncbi:MAG TPA: purine-nucleoside phosphorylase [Polyangium sp.]|nr:purine-nucleoside phosphorylase [Polyangium sp.]
MSLRSQLDQAVSAIRNHSSTGPLVGIVLGSGLGAWADTLDVRVSIPYSTIPSMPRSTVAGHAGNLVLGLSGGVPVACLQGRAHLYEGNTPEQSVFGVRLLARLGCRVTLLTNAAGGIRAGFQPGDLMLIRDHLNLTGTNPLVGTNDDAIGPRFPDMTNAYDDALAKLALDAAKKQDVRLHEGVYAGLLGPSYETPAEIRMLRTMGADSVGMSTVHEVIALRHMGVRCGAISVITNLAAGLGTGLLDHSEVEQTARQVQKSLRALLSEWILEIGHSLRDKGI